MRLSYCEGESDFKVVAEIKAFYCLEGHVYFEDFENQTYLSRQKIENSQLFEDCMYELERYGHADLTDTEKDLVFVDIEEFEDEKQ